MIKIFGRQEYSGKIQLIAPAGSEKIKGCVFRARRKILFNELAANPTIHIAAESYYVLYLNGKQIGSGPARGTENCNFLDTYDIAEYAIKGENSIAVEVFCNNFSTFMASPAQPALFISAGNSVCDHRWQVQLAQEYRTQDVPNYTPQMGLMEWRDLRKSPQGWQTFADDTAWLNAQIIDPSRKIYSKKLFLRDIPQLSQTEIQPVEIPVMKTVKRLDDIQNPDVATVLEKEKRCDIQMDFSALIKGQPQKIQPVSDGGGVAFVVDFRYEFAGHFCLDIDAPEGTIIDVGYQEAIAGDRLNLSVAEYRFADRYILAEGRQSLSNPLRWRGGRYMQLVLREFHRDITIYSLKIIDKRYPISIPSEFNCDEEFYADLWSRSLLTLSSCATDTIIDCPWREMSFWVNDFLVVNRYWLQMTGREDLSRRCLSLALSQRRDDGLIPGVCPYDGNPKVVLFATNLFLPLILWDYLVYTGDRNYVKEVLDEVSDIVEKCGSFSDSQGLLNPPDVYWNFIDWSFELNGITLNGRNSCALNWFYVLALSALSDIYQPMDAARAADYRERARRVAQQIEKAFWNQQQECFIEYLASDQNDQPPLAGKLAHALALLSGHVSDGIRGQVERAIFREDLLMPELYMMHFLFEAMIKLEKPREIERLIKKYWKPNLDSGCLTIWEMGVHQQGKAAINNYGSVCHAFSLAPVNYLQRYVLGLAPTREGFPKISFCPNLGDLSEVKGSVNTPLGRISVECRRMSGAIEADIDIPSGITIELLDGRIFKTGQQRVIIQAN
jgi:hypothetical protein